MKWYLKALKKYAVFRGRARRKEYWMYILINFLVFMGLGGLDALIFGENSPLVTEDAPPTILFYIMLLYYLGTILPTLAVTVRRLHDSGRSGWWFLISFIPLIGAIVMLVFTVMESDSENRFGSNPKQAA
ncbi:DUF805 domain-containing protein [Halobacillus salinus]|uniref:DUF805 domain-containing protein n=1 Tax=Halobacillus salinus TaxID=192814 RepID=A0A4Z0GWR1_9BACI|nr:DUF805 domain-containing protein [Halobacillus salinus]TGB01462.1 DUF805 domain-containing protein [Halobacillus salinus]